MSKKEFWTLTLDHDTAFWLSDLMKTIQKTFHNNKTLRFGSGDITRGQDIIRQLGNIPPPRIKLPFDVKIELDMGDGRKHIVQDDDNETNQA